MKRVGIIDVGSNSHRLLALEIGEGGARELARGRITTRMLSGLRDGAFTQEAIDRNLQAIAELKAIGQRAGADRFVAFATSAMRDASNRQAVIDAAARIGVEMRVMTGREEAELAYAGVGQPGRVGVIDIGGGSTEILTGEDGDVRGGGSAQMGAVRLTERMPGDPEPARLIAAAREALAPVYASAARIPVERWIGVGGTITTLAAMDMRLTEYDAQRIQGHPLSRAGVLRRLEELSAMTLEQRRCVPGLQPRRADIICAGIAILAAFFELSGADGIAVSDSDNLMGFAVRYADAL